MAVSPIGINRRVVEPSGGGKAQLTGLDQDIDRLSKALNIAKAGFGIAVDFGKFDLMSDKQNKLRAETKKIQGETIQDVPPPVGGTVTGEGGLTSDPTPQDHSDLNLTTQLKIEELNKAKGAEKVALDKDKQVLAKRFNNDSIIVKNTNSLNQAVTTIESLQDQDEPDFIRANLAMTTLLKAAGEDRVSDADILRVIGDPSLAARAVRATKEIISGKKPVSDIEAMIAIAEVYRERAEDNIMNRGIKIARTEGQRFGTAEEVLRDLLKPKSGLSKPSAKKITLQQPSPEEVKAVMQARPDLTEEQAVDALIQSSSGGKP